MLSWSQSRLQFIRLQLYQYANILKLYQGGEGPNEGGGGRGEHPRLHPPQPGSLPRDMQVASHIPLLVYFKNFNPVCV